MLVWEVGKMRSIAWYDYLRRHNGNECESPVAYSLRYWIKKYMSYQPLSHSVLRHHLSRVLRQYWILVCTGHDQMVMVVTISYRRTPCL